MAALIACPSCLHARTPFTTAQPRRRRSPTPCAAHVHRESDQQTASRRDIAAALLCSPVLLVAGAADAKDLKQAEKEKEERKRKLKEKVQQKAGDPSFEDEEYGKNYVPPESQGLTPSLLKNV